MAYKAAFRPIEGLIDGHWVTLPLTTSPRETPPPCWRCSSPSASLPARSASPTPATTAAASTSRFRNADGRPLANLHFADEAVILPLVPSASGALYRNGDIRLHTKDDDALLEDGKGNQRRCTRGTTPPAGAQAAQPAAASSFIDITGHVTTLARIALPPDATLTIRVEDTGRPGKPLTLAEQSYALNGAQVPIPFAASVDRDLIGKKKPADRRRPHRGRPQAALCRQQGLSGRAERSAGVVRTGAQTGQSPGALNRNRWKILILAFF
jgi:uncharacterized lipoprotein YbaY